MSNTSFEKSSVNFDLVSFILISVVISSLITGSSVYVYQKNQNDKFKANLESQLATLQSQVVLIQKETPTNSFSNNPTPLATPTNTPTSLLSTTQLLNFTYKNISGVSVELKDGVGTFKVTPTSNGSLGVVKNQPLTIIQGDLDGDGTPDSVVQLFENEGGSGSSSLIAAVLNKNGQPLLAGEAGIFGDRDTVDSITISNGIITVKGKIHGPNQPLADEANQPKTELYRITNGQLVAQ